MIRVLALLILLAGPALAEAPTTSPVPRPRPDVVKVVRVATGPVTSPLPAPRPKDLVHVVSTRAEPVPEVVPEPEKKPNRKRGKGLCNDPRLAGERLEDIGNVEGCGIVDPVNLREVSGVALSSPATVDCGTAVALADWIEQVAKPAFRKTGGGLARLQVIDSYSCRPRNNVKGNRLSEHGKGHAVDIGGFILAKGTVITVLGDWGKGSAGKILATIRKGACGIFNTVLGPGSDSFHRNHFHFDTARYRRGAYCH